MEAAPEAQSEKMHKPRVLISHPTGNQNVRNALASLAERENAGGILDDRCLGCAVSLEPAAAVGNADAARAAHVCGGAQRAHQVRSMEGDGSSGRQADVLNSLLTSGERPFSIIGVYRHFDGKVARRVPSLHPDVVYAYEGGARETFREARRLGIKTIYELPSSYWYWVRGAVGGSRAQP
jgi:hypothetical protein